MFLKSMGFKGLCKVRNISSSQQVEVAKKEHYKVGHIWLLKPKLNNNRT